MQSEHLPEIINGWFIVALSREVPRGSVRVVSHMGHALALYRGASGQLFAVEGFCPHLGASFASMGRVVGDELRCSAHGFQYAPDGTCTHAYGVALGTVRLRTFPVRETHGAIALWLHHEQAEPSWELPRLSAAAWQVGRPLSVRLRGQPQTVLEHAPTLAPLGAIEGLGELDASTLERSGSLLRIVTSVPVSLGAGRARTRFPMDVRYDVLGLGLAMIESYVPRLGLHVRTFVAPTPVGRKEVDVRAWLAVRDFVPAVPRLDEGAGVLSRLGLSAALPRAAASSLLGQAAHAVLRQGLKRGLRALDRASLRGASPLEPHTAAFREWARQFYAPSAHGRSLPVLVA